MYIKYETTNTIVIEKSRFLTFIKRVKTEQEYKDYLNEIRKKYHDASHVCSALVLGQLKRSSDDGEPSGTAGRPILNVLEKQGLDETCALVVRYFGGIKLGAGGLVRAYGSAVSNCLSIAKLVEDVEYPKYELVLSYDLANKVNHIIDKEAINISKDYGESVKFTYLSNNEKLIDKIAEITSGIKPKYIGNEVIQKDV